MTFRPFNPETLAELAAIQERIDFFKTQSGPHDQEMVHKLERDREAIYQADYDLSRQHR